MDDSMNNFKISFTTRVLDGLMYLQTCITINTLRYIIYVHDICYGWSVILFAYTMDVECVWSFLHYNHQCHYQGDQRHSSIVTMQNNHKLDYLFYNSIMTQSLYQCGIAAFNIAAAPEHLCFRYFWRYI